MENITFIYKTIILIIGILTFFRTIYIGIGFLFKPKRFPETTEFKRYGVVIAARNEELVIGNLIKSIRMQNYPQDLLSIFVVADNCNDKTAQRAYDEGAIVYERFNKNEISKGYALQYLFKKIKEDYKETDFDGFIVFDADNILDANCIKELNKAFVSGLDVVTGFRNIKNFDTNFISASYGFHFYRNTLTLHRPRQVLKLSTNITGTGFLFKSSLVSDGWNYTQLTEDYEFSINLVTKGHKIGYCEEAIFYDEQPTDIKTVLKQRLRWSRGHIINFFANSHRLLLSFFKKPTFDRYDIYLQMIPLGLLTFILGLIIQIIALFYQPSIMPLLIFYRDFLITTYLSSLFIGFFTLIFARKKFHCSKPKLFIYFLLWPYFDLLSLPLTIIVLFKKVKWAPIKHKDTRLNPKKSTSEI